MGGLNAFLKKVTFLDVIAIALLLSLVIKHFMNDVEPMCVRNTDVLGREGLDQSLFEEEEAMCGNLTEGTCNIIGYNCSNLSDPNCHNACRWKPCENWCQGEFSSVQQMCGNEYCSGCNGCGDDEIDESVVSATTAPPPSSVDLDIGSLITIENGPGEGLRIEPNTQCSSDRYSRRNQPTCLDGTSYCHPNNYRDNEVCVGTWSSGLNRGEYSDCADMNNRDDCFGTPGCAVCQCSEQDGVLQTCVHR